MSTGVFTQKEKAELHLAGSLLDFPFMDLKFMVFMPTTVGINGSAAPVASFSARPSPTRRSR